MQALIDLIKTVMAGVISNTIFDYISKRFDRR